MSLLLKRPDRSYLVRPGDRLETDLGIIEVPDEISPGEYLESHLGTTFLVTKPNTTDFFEHLDRGGAPMIPRDIGLVIGLLGVQSGDRVIDVGTGTGILAIAMARLGVEVVTFERDPDTAELARANVARASVTDAVQVHDGDAVDATLETGFDAMTLDTGDASTLVERASEVLVPGGVVVAYSPFIEQARAVTTSARASKLTSVETYDTVQRMMDFDERGSRPTTGPVGHTGYLTVARFLPTLA